MARHIAWAVILSATLACGGGDARNPIGDSVGGSGRSANRPPAILRVTVAPQSIDRAGAATLTVVAEDPDGDGVSFTYQAQHGRLTPDGSTMGQARYVNDGSDFTVDKLSVTVTDKNQLSVTASADLQIVLPPSPTATPTPTPKPTPTATPTASPDPGDDPTPRPTATPNPCLVGQGIAACPVSPTPTPY